MVEMIGDRVAEFKRGPDKKKRKPRSGNVATAAILGAVGGTALDVGRRVYQVSALEGQRKRRFAKTGLGMSDRASEKLLSRTAITGPKSGFRLLKARTAGAVAGVGAYGAYRGVKALRNRRKRK